MQFRRRLQPRANVDLVPMIDVVFQLVVFFMVSSTFIVTPGINLELPNAGTAEPVAMTRLVVTVTADEVIYINQEAHDLEGFTDALAREAAEGNEAEAEQTKTVVIEADSAVTYDVLVSILDVLRSAGYRGVNLRTQPLEEGAGAAGGVAE